VGSSGVFGRSLPGADCTLPPAEQTLLDAARAGTLFGELCELLCAEVGAAAPAKAAALLRGWVDAGLISGARPADALSTLPQ